MESMITFQSGPNRLSVNDSVAPTSLSIEQFSEADHFLMADGAPRIQSAIAGRRARCLPIAR